MKQGLASRLAKLETFTGQDLLVVIRRKFVSDDGEELPPAAYRDGLGNRMSRRHDEDADAFRARASEAAINAGASRVAVLIPQGGIYETRS